MPVLREIRADSNHWVGARGALILLFWIDRIDPIVCRNLPRIAREVARGLTNQRVGVLSVALPSAKAPSMEARQALAAVIRDSEPSIASIAVVREGQGFVASTAASIMVGIQMLARSTKPHKAFTRLDDAVRWLRDGIGDSFGTADSVEVLVEVVQRQRSALLQPRSLKPTPSLRA